MWHAFMHDKNDPDAFCQEVPGVLPLNRRQAMTNCENHAKEYAQ